MKLYDTPLFLTLLDIMQSDPLLLLGILLLLLAALLFLRRTRLQTQHIVVNDDEGGKVLISHRAIKNLVANVCNEVPTIRYTKSRLTPLAENYKLEVHILVSPQIRLSAISQYLQEQLNLQLSNNLDFNGLANIDIVVDGFITNPSSPRSKELPEPEINGME